MRNLAVQHLAAGRGLGVLDPHGDLADALLEEIPPGRMDQVVAFDPADLAHPVGLNLLAQVPRDERPLVATGIVSAFRHLWAESWGPRSEYILTNAIAALLDCPPSVGATLLGVPQVKRRFDPAATLERGQVLIANLAKGKLGEAESGLLGALLVTALYLAALGRARQAPGERRPFHLIIDEFQSFSTDSLASILAEARKYGLSLTLAHQYLDQLRDDVRQALFGNVGTTDRLSDAAATSCSVTACRPGSFRPGWGTATSATPCATPSSLRSRFGRCGGREIELATRTPPPGPWYEKTVDN